MNEQIHEGVMAVDGLSMADLRSVTENAAQREAAEDLAHNLRKIADIVASQPEHLKMWRSIFSQLRYYAVTEKEFTDATLAVMPYARRTEGGERGLSKDADRWYMRVHGYLGQLPITISSDRNLVCTKVVTGTETVTREIPDPDAPKITVTEEQEIVEWECPPLLSKMAGSE